MFNERRVEIRQGNHRPHGTLIGFGSQFEELNDGVGQFTTAIVVLDCGVIREIPVTDIWCIT